MNAGLDRSDDLDIGRLGFSGHFDTMITRLEDAVPRIIQLVALWVWYAGIPPTFDYQLSPELNARLLGYLAIAFFLLKEAIKIVTALWHGAKWLLLEAHGLRWVTINDQNFRVSFYRASDNTLKPDKKTRDQRFDEERDYKDRRRLSAWHDLGRLVLYFCAAGFMPYLFRLAYGVIEAQWDHTGEVRGASEQWHVLAWCEWLLLLILIVPLLVHLLGTLFTLAVYGMDANYISGAHVRDGFVAPKTVETVRESRQHGDARFADPDDAADSMGDDG